MNNWFYLRRKGRITGPFEASQLKERFLGGGLALEDEISSDKVSWGRIGETAWLNPAFRYSTTIDLRKDVKSQRTTYIEPEDPDDIIPLATVPNFSESPVPETPNEDMSESGQVKPLDNNEIEGEDGDDSFRRLYGDVLSLIWNSTDFLLKIPQRYGDSGVIKAGLLAWFNSLILVALAMVLFGSCYSFWEGGPTVIAGILLTLGLGVVLWLELVSCRIIAGRNVKHGAWNFDLLVSSVVLQIFIAGAMLSLATVHYIKQWNWLMYPNILVWSVVFANSSAALRIGLTRFSDIRPRHAVWLSALITCTLALVIMWSCLRWIR